MFLAFPCEPSVCHFPSLRSHTRSIWFVFVEVVVGLRKYCEVVYVTWGRGGYREGRVHGAGIHFRATVDSALLRTNVARTATTCQSKHDHAPCLYHDLADPKYVLVYQGVGALSHSHSVILPRLHLVLRTYMRPWFWTKVETIEGQAELSVPSCFLNVRHYIGYLAPLVMSV